MLVLPSWSVSRELALAAGFEAAEQPLLRLRWPFGLRADEDVAIATVLESDWSGRSAQARRGRSVGGRFESLTAELTVWLDKVHSEFG